ncbi:hypothetical protein QA648_35160 (plasmid) [Rhizobium sp. CB3171]|uniref:hypothetical protein n=1 Tax=Rhizobium sp. CB3171 TaxID=3039157 RepID=UPI0024B2353F|nr:hypothetical protein [Rhizobium sp. CB3171]WFU07147.1 hypothetical protein QA648_35160 [Rhizobium sp. CB3171]
MAAQVAASCLAVSVFGQNFRVADPTPIGLPAAFAEMKMKSHEHGTRPSAHYNQRSRFGYIFGAICSQLGKTAALVMPWCDTCAMNQPLIDIKQCGGQRRPSDGSG